MDDVKFAHNVPAYTATRKKDVLKVTAKVATPGTESAVYDCLVLKLKIESRLNLLRQLS